MAKFKMPAGGIGVGRGSNSNGSAAVADEPVQAGVGNSAAEETTSVDTAVAMLESDEPEGEEDEGGTLAAEFDEHPAEMSERTATPHTLYKTGDENAPSQILDSNGEVVLAMCRVCGKAESELDAPCIPPVIDDAAADPTLPAQEKGEQAAAEPAPEAAAAAEPPPPSDQPSPAARALFAKYQAIREWEENCEEAKEKFVAAALAHAELKAATKIAKAEEEDTMEAYAKLMRQNPETNMAMVKPVVVRPCDVPVAEIAEVAGNTEGLAVELPVEQPANSDAWRSAPITVLTSLTPALLEKLQEAGLTTIGKLEDRRAEIALSNGGEKWPKGIGEVKITAIEDAVVDWLTENRDKAVFAGLESGRQTEQGEATEEVQAGEGDDAPDGFTGADDAANYVADESAHYTSAITFRATQLDNGEPDALDDKLNAGNWEQGYEHYEAGGALAACGLPPSPAQDDFIRGYLSAAKVADYMKREGATKGAGTKATPGAEKPILPAPSPVSGAEQVDLDDL